MHNLTKLVLPVWAPPALTCTKSSLSCTCCLSWLQVDAQLSQLDELCQEAARRQHTPAATAATAEVAAAHVTAQVKLLAALRKIAEGVYAPAAPEAAGAPASQPEALAPSATAAATVLQPGRVASGSGGGSSGGSSSSKAHWLLGALDHWLLELAVGELFCQDMYKQLPVCYVPVSTLSRCN